MKKFYLFIALLLVLTGCTQDRTKLTFEKLDQESVDQDIQRFMEGSNKGVHIYYETEDLCYIYLNDAQVKQGEAATYITDFDMYVEGDTLKILYESEETTNYTKEDVDFSQLYKVQNGTSQSYEVLQLYHNGEKEPIARITTS